jgi:hypothetical protein
MPRVGFEPTIPVFHRTKTFRVLDRSSTVIGPVSTQKNRIKDKKNHNYNLAPYNI